MNAMISLTLACSSDAGGPVLPARLEVTPASVTLEALGDVATLAVRAFTSDNVEIVGIRAMFESLQPGVVTADASGRVTAVSNGATSVRVRVSSSEVLVPVTVQQRIDAVATIPERLEFFSFGDTARLSAVGRDPRGNNIALTNIFWSADDAAVATVDASGLVTAVTDGETRVTARTATHSASAAVRVQRRIATLALPGDTVRSDAIGDSVVFALEARDARGGVIPSPGVTWESSDTSIVRVTSPALTVTEGNGVAQVRVRAGTVQAARAVHVNQVPTSLMFQKPPASFIVEGESVDTVVLHAKDRKGAMIRHVGLNVDVTLAAPAPNAGKLVGTTRAALVNGVATLGALSIDRSGPAYRLHATLGSLSTTSTPIDVSLRFVSLSGHNRTVCAKDVRSDLWCWGSNEDTTLANASTPIVPAPKRFPGAQFYRKVDFGGGAVCVFMLGATTRCWGGMFGGIVPPVTTAIRSSTLATEFLNHCGATASGDVWCWGQDFFGARGAGSVTNFPDASVTRVAGGHVFSSVQSATYSACGVRNDRAVLCWGWNRSGQLGIGVLPTQAESVPTATVVSPGVQFQQVSYPAWPTGCALDFTGLLHCWGSNSIGNYTDRSVVPNFSATPIVITGEEPFTKALVSAWHTCALSVTGRAFCWGNNSGGPLANGNFNGMATQPTPVATTERFTDIVGGQILCGLTQRGLVYCWGYGVNADGTLLEEKGDFVARVVRAPTIIP